MLPSHRHGLFRKLNELFSVGIQEEWRDKNTTEMRGGSLRCARARANLNSGVSASPGCLHILHSIGGGASSIDAISARRRTSNIPTQSP